MDIKSLTLCIFTIFPFCLSVNLEYYADDDTIDNETDEDQSNQRMGDEIIDSTANLTPDVKTANENLTTSTTNLLRKYNYDSIDAKNNTSYVGLMHVFDDYEYQYANDRDSDLEILQLTTVSNTNYVDSIEFPKVNTSNIKHADIYNLEPALTKIVINKTPLVKSSKRVWYVPEPYPCWRLPLVYGRLKQKINWSHVFVLKGPELGNVKLGPPEKENVTPRNHPMFDSCNEWCEQGPCYGDHTLCIYSNDTISRICGEGFKVNKLSAYEQMAVTNTINKIRNRVALGSVYPLPSASNMHLIRYDTDLAMISNRWVRQCLPGPAPCSSLNNNLVTQLECMKTLRSCCLHKRDVNCVPPEECFVSPLVGCLHAWFLSAADILQKRNIKCGFITQDTFNTAQILWAKTSKIGCAYGEKANGDIRVICNFSPGAPFFLRTDYYCGLVPQKDITQKLGEDLDPESDITSFDFLASLGVHMNEANLALKNWKKDLASSYSLSATAWGVGAMYEKLKEDSLRAFEDVYDNGTIGAVAKLVTKYTFFEEYKSRCENNEAIYATGAPGSACEATSREFTALCFLYRNPYPFYRITAIAAPVALFCLILYDLFNGVIRQTNF